MRIVRACHDLGIEAVAVYSTADRDGLWVELADRAVCIGPHQPAESYLNVLEPDRGRRDHRLRRRAPGLGVPGRERRLRARLRRQRPGVRGPAGRGDGGDGRQEPRPRGDARGRRAARARVARPPGRRRPGAAAWRPRSATRCCSRRSAGGGGRGMRLVADPADIEDAYGMASAEALTSFGDGGMYLEKAVVERPPRRDAGAGRRRGRRARPRRARLLRAAPPPEADRGGAVARARRGHPRAHGRARRGWRAPAAATATPAPSSSCSTADGPLLLHRDEHPPPGRAPRVRARDRASTWPPGSCASPAASRCRPPASPTCAATRSSSASTARTPPTSSALRPGRRPRSGRRSGRGAGRHARLRGLPRAAVLRLAAGEADRLGRATAPRRSTRPGGRCAELEIEGVATTRAALPRDRPGAGVPARAATRPRYLDDARGRLPSLVPGDGGMSPPARHGDRRRRGARTIVRGAVASVSGARLDAPGRVSRVLPGRRGPGGVGRSTRCGDRVRRRHLARRTAACSRSWPRPCATPSPSTSPG